MLSASPQPVSISTKRGREVAFVILLTSIRTSFIDVIPRSGNPYEAAATPLPDKYIAL